MPKKRSGCHRRPRRSAKPTTNKSMKCGGRTHSTAIQTAKEQACGVREAPHRDQLTTNLNAEMKRLFVAVTIACLGTILVSVSAHAARNLAVDDKGNLFVADTDSILKFTPDGKRSTFASGLNDANDMAFDDKGNLFVRDGNTIFKFTPEGVKSTFASGIVPETYDPYHVAEVFTGLALDRSGNLFVAEHVSGSILILIPEGKTSTVATGISYPGDLVVDRAGNLFVSGSGLI